MIVKGRNVKVDMQRRHMEFIAEVVGSIQDDRSRNEIAMLFADAMNREGVNRNFNRQRFVEACTKR